MFKLSLVLSALLSLTGCLQDTGGSGTASNLTGTVGATWPPASSSEFLAYVDGKSFKLVGYDAILAFSSGTLTYDGAAGTHHTATVRQYNGSGAFIGTYQTPRQCTYSANEFLPDSLSNGSFDFKFNVTASNDGEPYYNTNCKKPATNPSVYYESATIELVAETGCFLYDGEKFCVQ